MRALLGELHKQIDALEAAVEPTWAGLVEPLERISDRHQRTWGVVSHLKVRGRRRAARRARGPPAGPPAAAQQLACSRLAQLPARRRQLDAPQPAGG
jgi:hypothetical protein